MMEMTSAFSKTLTTTEEPSLVNTYFGPNLSDKHIPWRRFLLQFPSVKALRMEVTRSLHIASALNQDHEEPNISFLAGWKRLNCVRHENRA
jgi:hypothetical protein